MEKNILVLAFGNDIIGDDAAALEAAKLLAKQFGEKVDFEEVYGGGLEVLDFIEGRDKVLILDSITTEANPVGTVISYGKDALGYGNISSPHYVGLPEVLKLSAMFEMDIPQDIRILAIEIDLQSTIIEELSPEIQATLPNLVNEASKILSEWLEEEDS